MKNYQTVILSNQEISPAYYRMRIFTPSFGETARPGQFVMFRVQGAGAPLLRRPFGIFRIGFLPRLCRAAGERIPGDPVQSRRRRHRHDERTARGGSGRGSRSARAADSIPAFSGWKKYWSAAASAWFPCIMLAGEPFRGNSVRLLMGGRSRDDILAVTEFERLGVRRTSPLTTAASARKAW